MRQMGTAEAPEILIRKAFLDGFWWIHDTVVLSAACQCLECHSTSNTQTVQMCLFFMEYGAIGRGQGTHHFCLWPCFTPPAFPHPRTSLAGREWGWQEENQHFQQNSQLSLDFRWVQPRECKTRIAWGLFPGPLDTPSMLPQPRNIQPLLECVQTQQPPHSNIQSWASLI